MDTFDEWDRGLKLAKEELRDELFRLRDELVFFTLGAAVEISPGRFQRISGVVFLTPVDTGRARSSWNVSAVTPSRRVPPPGSRPTSDYISEARQALSSIGTYDAIWITSSLPYIHVLEFGLYPNPPKSGIKTVGGFSRQAPNGMVRVTWRQVLKALKGREL
jgi:hypothetical protein